MQAILRRAEGGIASVARWGYELLTVGIVIAENLPKIAFPAGRILQNSSLTLVTLVDGSMLPLNLSHTVKRQAVNAANQSQLRAFLSRLDII